MLLRFSNLKVIVTGGVLYRENFILNGQVTNQTLANLNVTKAFICTPALHPEKGLTHFDDILVPKTNMIRSSKEVFVVTDHSKVGKISLHTFANMSEIDHVITDNQLNELMQDELRNVCGNVWIV